MPKKIPSQELDEIIAALGRYSEGVPVRLIRANLSLDLPPRMLQRRLSLLVDQGRVIAEGSGKGRRYSLPAQQGGSGVDIAFPVRVEARGESYIPISEAGRLIRDLVRSPMQARQPVGYDRSFLEDYQPNRSFYLPATTRRQLADIGRSFDIEYPAGTYARKVYDRLLIDLSWNSSRLEGNTYSLLETERLIELGEQSNEKDAQETQMILNHKAAIELLVDQADDVGFNAFTIQNLHALLADNLLADPQAVGRLRQIAVSIGGTVYHPLEVPQIIEECFDLVLSKASEIVDPFEQSFFALVHLAYLQAFEDVNKRVSRLAANIPLIRNNHCPLSFVDVPERVYIDGILGVYELNRIELLRDVFIWAYQRSSARYSAVRQSLGEPDRFRMRHRTMIGDLVSRVVREKMDKRSAVRLLRQFGAEYLMPEDRARFIEVVETELMNLHAGSIARYRLRADEFDRWQEVWL